MPDAQIISYLHISYLHIDMIWHDILQLLNDLRISSNQWPGNLAFTYHALVTLRCPFRPDPGFGHVLLHIVVKDWPCVFFRFLCVDSPCRNGEVQPCPTRQWSDILIFIAMFHGQNMFLDHGKMPWFPWVFNWAKHDDSPGELFAPVLWGKNMQKCWGKLVYISNTSQWGAKTRDLFPTMSYQSAMNLLFDMASLSDTFRLQGPLPCARPERSPCQLSCFWHPSPCPARYGKVKLMASSRASSSSKIKLQWCAQRIPKGAFGRRHHDRDIHWFEESTRKQSSEKFRLGMSLCDCTLCSR